MKPQTLAKQHEPRSKAKFHVDHLHIDECEIEGHGCELPDVFISTFQLSGLLFRASNKPKPGILGHPKVHLL